MSDDFNIEEIRDFIQDDIVGCYNCQPYDSGEVFWLGSHTDLYDLLIDYDLSDDEKEEVISELSCPKCGTDLDVLSAEVQVKTEYDRKVEKVFDSLDDEKYIE